MRNANSLIRRLFLFLVLRSGHRAPGRTLQIDAVSTSIRSTNPQRNTERPLKWPLIDLHILFRFCLHLSPHPISTGQFILR